LLNFPQKKKEEKEEEEEKKEEEEEVVWVLNNLSPRMKQEELYSLGCVTWTIHKPNQTMQLCQTQACRPLNGNVSKICSPWFISPTSF
jgi:hypothetical protein